MIVLAIWGVIGYRIIDALTPEEAIIEETIVNANFNPKPIPERKRFTINTYNRDPFLGTIKRKRVVPSKKSVVRPITKKEPWPDIRFAGSVGDSGSKEDIFFIYIDNTQYLFTPGMETQGVKLVKGNEAGITLSFKGKRRQYTLDE